MVSQRECHGCKKMVPASDMKYMLKGKSMVAVCPECRTKNAAPADKSMKKEAPQKKTYICAKCKYKFKVNPDHVCGAFGHGENSLVRHPARQERL